MGGIIGPWGTALPASSVSYPKMVTANDLEPVSRTPATVGVIPATFPTWLQTMRDENTGSARDVLERVAAELGIVLDRS